MSAQYLPGERLDELIAEYFARVEAGESIEPDDYAARHPDEADALRQFFLEERLVERVTARLRAVATPPTPSPVPQQLGDFRILREVGRGGMGIVYEAEQLSLGRRVALKVLPFATLLDPRHLQRFKNEAQAAASLDHASIVHVYAVGCERGVHYFAMQYVEGCSLAQFIAARRKSLEPSRDQEKLAPSTNSALVTQPPLAPDTLRASLDTTAQALDYITSAARLIIQAAEALEYAHQMGVVHRDIKPSNLLVDAAGHVWIADFGLAQMQTDQNLTMTGDLVGTLRYMSPEQATGRRAVLDQRTDVYSLGITLYELVTLHPAFEEDDRHELLHHILDKDPPAPRKVDPHLPRDLETIILKAIAKSPLDRYASAGELAADLTRYLESRPIRARRTSRVQRLRYWARRNPTVAGLAAAVVLLILGLAVAGPVVAVRQARMARLARHNEYVALMNGAYTSWNDGNLVRVDEVLSRYSTPRAGEDFRNFEYYHLLKLYRDGTDNVLFNHSGRMRAMAVAHDGRLAATAGRNGRIRIWNIVSRKELPVEISHPGGVAVVALSPDGRLLASGGEGDAYGIRIWNVESGDLLTTLRPHASRITALAVANDGGTWASGAYDGTIAVWDAAGTVRRSISGHTGSIDAITFSPSGQQLVTGGKDQTVCVWSVSTGERTARHSIHGRFSAPVAFAKNGDELLVGGRGVSVLSLKTGKAVHRFRLPLRSTVAAIAVSDDGLVATGTYANLVQLWDYLSGDLLATLAGHGDTVLTVAFSPDAKTLISGSADGVVKSWSVEAHTRRDANTDRNWLTPVEFSPHGDILISAQAEPFSPRPQQGTIKWWDANRGRLIRSLSVESWYAKRITISPDDVIAACGGKGIVKRWQLNTGKELKPVLFGDEAICDVPRYSGDGRWLAVGGRLGPVGDEPSAILLWLVDRQTGERHSLKVPGLWEYPLSIAFSADSRRVALGGGGWRTAAFARVWEVSTREVIAHMPHDVMVYCVTFAPDGRTLAAASHDGVVRLWDIETGETRTSMRFPLVTMSVAFSPDGNLLAVCGSDHTVRLWSLERDAELAVIPVHEVPCSVAFSPDGQTLVWGGFDGTVNFLRGPTARPTNSGSP